MVAAKMSSVARRSRRICNVRYAIFCTTVALAYITALIWYFSTEDQADQAANAGWQWVPWVLFGALAWFGVRSWFIGVTISEHEVIRHGWFRTRHLRVADIRRVRFGAYDGSWSRGGPPALWMVILDLQAGRTMNLPELVGRPKTAQDLADRLSEACRIPIPPRSTLGGRHRAP